MADSFRIGQGVTRCAAERGRARLLIAVLLEPVSSFAAFSGRYHATARRVAAQESARSGSAAQSQEEADRKSAGCMSCHTATDEPTMHPSKGVHIGLHGLPRRKYSRRLSSPGTSPTSLNISPPKKKRTFSRATVFFKNRTAIPERAYTDWLKESAGVHQIHKSR